ncbi:MAG: DUF6151 family protein [Pseudomonadota bacterium]
MDWSCKCGALKLQAEPGRGTRIACYCKDCQAFAKAIGAADTLDPQGGSDLYQTAPDTITVVEGAEHLACLRLTNKGPLRWYAACCGTPVANTLTTRQVPFSSLAVTGFADPSALGPVSAQVNLSGATGHVETTDTRILPLVLKFMGRALIARVTGRHRKTPFFDSTGTPVAEIRWLTEEERAKAYG